MSVSYNPSIVTDQLLLCLDPGNTKSYPGSGTAFSDISGNGNHATLVGSPTFNSTNGGTFTTDGSTQYGYIPYSASLCPSAAISYGCWAYRADWNVTTNKKMLSKTQSGGYNLAMNDNTVGYINGSIFISGAYRAALYPLSSMTPGWHCIMITCDGQYTRIYVDGVLGGTDNRGSVGTIQYSVNNNFVYGSEANTGGSNSVVTVESWAGAMGPAFVYGKQLTAAEVAQNFNAYRGRFGI